MARRNGRPSPFAGADPTSEFAQSYTAASTYNPYGKDFLEKNLEPYGIKPASISRRATDQQLYNQAAAAVLTQFRKNNPTKVTPPKPKPKAAPKPTKAKAVPKVTPKKPKRR